MFNRSARPRRAGLLSLLVAALFLPLTAARAQDEAKVPDVVSVAPADADLIVVVPNLAQSSKRIADFAAALGAKDMLGNIDPLLAVKQRLGISKGLDDNGSAMIVAYDLVGMIRDQTEPPFAVVLPVSDYKAFIGNFATKRADGIDQLDTELDRPVYARSVGKFAVVSLDRDRLKAFNAGNAADSSVLKSVGKLGGKVMARSDASIYINFKSLAAALKPELDRGLEDMQQQLGSIEQFGGIQGEMAGLAKWIGLTFYDVINGVLRDGDSLVIGAELGGDGIGLSAAVQFQEGSKLAKRFSGAKSDAAGMMAAVPNGNYLFAFGADFSGIDLKGMVDDLTANMPKQGVIASTLRQSIESMANQKRMSMAWYAGPQGILGGFSSVTVSDPIDAKAYFKTSKAAIEDLNKLKIDLGEDDDGRPMTMGFTSTFEENVHKVEGVSVSRYVIDLKLPKALVNQLGPAAGMMVQMGLTHQAGYMADVDGRVITTSKEDLDLTAGAIKAVKSGKGLGATGMIPKVRKAGVPDGAMAEGYLNVSAIVELANPFMPFLGMEPINVPQNLPPLALSGMAEDGGVGAKLFMPMPMVNWAKEIYMGLQGGDGGQNTPRNGPPEAPF